jgi:hypothetical protein
MPLPASVILGFGLNAGGKVQDGAFVLKDEPLLIFSDPIANFVSVPKVEAFVQTNSQTFSNQKVFASGLAEDTGNLEVEVAGFWKGRMEAAGRFVLSVPNDGPDPLDGLHFHFVIPSGEISFFTFAPNANATPPRGRVAANVSTELTEIGVGPLGMNPLFAYVLDVADTSAGLRFNEKSDDVVTRPLDFLTGVEISQFEGTIALPSVRSGHVLPVFYDMNASFSEPRFEAGGSAKIGDPLDLIAAGSAGLAKVAQVADVPEPATCGLLSLGPLLIAVRQRRQ